MDSSFGVPGVSAPASAWQQIQHLDDAERRDRLAADQALLDALRQAGFAGPDWEFVVGVLAEYGLAVIRSWIKKGLIESKCAEKKVKCPEVPDWVREDREAPGDIATETVAVAIVAYRDDVLVKGIWDPAKGASLKTFFINQCLFKFANAFRAWEKEHAHRSQELAVADFAWIDQGSVTTVEDDVLRTLAATMILNGASNARAARVLAMDACGYANADIAADIGVSVESVKSILKRERAKAATTKDRGAS